MDEEKVGYIMARDSKHEPRSIIKDIIFFFITVAGTYGYSLFLLLVLSLIFVRGVSFVNSSGFFLKFDFDHMLIYAGVFAGISAVWYIIKMIRKYNN
jgi:hypothetical protein